MSGTRRPPQGPWRKSATWRGGAFMIGIALLALVIDWVAGGLLEIGFGRMILVLLTAGATLSVPFGISWLRGEEPKVRHPPPTLPERVEGPPGATYIIVGTSESARTGGVSKGVKSRELSPGWYALYNVFWRWPMLTGDAVLTSAWTLIGRLSGGPSAPRRADLEAIENHETERRPDRANF